MGILDKINKVFELKSLPDNKIKTFEEQGLMNIAPPLIFDFAFKRIVIEDNTGFSGKFPMYYCRLESNGCVYFNYTHPFLKSVLKEKQYVFKISPQQIDKLRDIIAINNILEISEDYWDISRDYWTQSFSLMILFKNGKKKVLGDNHQYKYFSNKIVGILNEIKESINLTNFIKGDMCFFYYHSINPEDQKVSYIICAENHNKAEEILQKMYFNENPFPEDYELLSIGYANVLERNTWAIQCKVETYQSGT